MDRAGLPYIRLTATGPPWPRSTITILSKAAAAAVCRGVRGRAPLAARLSSPTRERNTRNPRPAAFGCFPSPAPPLPSPPPLTAPLAAAAFFRAPPRLRVSCARARNRPPRARDALASDSHCLGSIAIREGADAKRSINCESRARTSTKKIRGTTFFVSGRTFSHTQHPLSAGVARTHTIAHAHTIALEPIDIH